MIITVIYVSIVILLFIYQITFMYFEEKKLNRKLYVDDFLAVAAASFLWPLIVVSVIMDKMRF